MEVDFNRIDNADNEELLGIVAGLKEELRNDIVIPAHHYQSEDIVRFADFVGDSYKLAVECSKVKKEFIVFCGVLFMAEGAGVLGGSNQKVLLPEPTAGCPMADMAGVEFVNKAFDQIREKTGNDIAPVVYMNSYADLKSFCGEKGGAVCTSSNAEKILSYFLGQGKSIMFFPDYYLGKNTARELGIDEKYVVKIKKNGDVCCDGDLKGVKIYLWDGFCPVHQRFTVGDITHLRSEFPGIKIIVHPECTEDVVMNSDLSGSTERIYTMIKDSAPGSVWGVGTETTFVNRLAAYYPDKKIMPLRVSACKNMVKISLGHLAKSLLSVKRYKENNEKLLYEVLVSDEYKSNAGRSLRKMIDIVNS